MEQFKEYLAIKRLLPEEVWNNYCLLGIKDLREQVMLRTARNALRVRMSELKEAWKKQKRLNKERKDEEKNSEHKTPKKTAKRVRNKRQRESPVASNSGRE